MEKSIVPLMGAVLLLGGVSPCVGAAEVASASLTATLDEKGTVERLTMADGYDFIAPATKTPLFSLRMTREDCFTNSAFVDARAAASCVAEPIPGGLRLVYGAIGTAVEKVVCSVRADAGDAKLRWRIAVTPKAGWRFEQANFPQMTLKTDMDGAPEREAVVGGSAKGGIFRNPSAAKPGSAPFYGVQPGQLVAQFVSFYDDKRLFYYGSEDAAGEAKALAVERSQAGLCFNGRYWAWDASGADNGFDFVTAALTGTERNPCDWRDAADFYRAWALKQAWCATPLTLRTDLPAWIREAPVMVRFYQQDFDDPPRIHGWLHDYWLKEFPSTPLVAAMWGWERSGTWVSDYFPCRPSDEAFRAVVDDLRRNGAHAFPWPSGYHWTKMYGRRPDGSFEYDRREVFAREIAPHAAVERDGSVNDREPGWLKGGRLSALCAGDPWTFAWWRDDVCRELARRGCEAIQADQICGGHFRDCWSTRHPHPPGCGRWKTETFRRQLVEMREAMRSAVADAVVCYEEPEELFNDLIGLQDYRDCNAPGEWASVFNYLYHEFVPCFQSNVYARGDRHMYAHLAVDGQIPFFGNPRPDDGVAERLAFDNGDFEAFSEKAAAFPSWEAYAGTHRLDAEIRHGGTKALRFETSGSNETQQISRNVTLDFETFRPGRAYRVSAWLRTERKGRGTNIGYGLYRPGFKSHAGHGSLAFPEPGEGWVRRQSTFTMPDEDGLTLRFMINAGRGDTRVWIDDVRLEEIAPDGVARDVRVSCRGWYHRFMSAWVKLYRGEGRAWLAHGRHVRPPRIRCGTTFVEVAESGKKGVKRQVPRPSVHHAAYVAADGTRAVFFASGLSKPQTFEYERADGTWCKRTIRPDEILWEKE